MFIIAGIIFLVAGLWRGSVLFYQMYKRPKVEAEIISKEKKTGYPPFKKKEHSFARVNYQFEEQRFENEEIALKIDAAVGEHVTCYVDPSNPKDAAQFAPKKDAIPVIAVLLIGAGLTVFHFWAMSKLDD